MIAVSSVLRRVLYPAMSGARIFPRRVHAGEVCVVTYHGVLPAGWTPAPSPIEGTLISAEQFRRQLRFLKSRYNVIAPDAFRSWLKGETALPPRPVLLTCDDGLLNVLTDMLPILLEEGARCLFFVTAASIEDETECLWYEELYRMLEDAPGDAEVVVTGQFPSKDSRAEKNLVAIWWSLVEELSNLNAEGRKKSLQSLRTQWRLPGGWRISQDERSARRYKLLNRDELVQLSKQGMTIGAHTLSHPLLAKMQAELAEQEIRECKTRLESHLQHEVWALAYPFGHKGSANEREMAIAEQAGYACAFLNCGGGLLRRTTPRFALSRAHVTSHMSLPELDAHLSGFHHSLQTAVRGSGSPS